MKTDIDAIYSILQVYTKKLPVPVVELIKAQTKDPFKVLVTTILSARTKDQITATVVKKLFKKISTPSDLKKYSQKQLEEFIYPIGFFRNKAKHLKELPDVLEKEFNGVIPDDVDTLTKLPGVGRKTANLVVAVAFAKPAICVDIHVHRISNRLGYVKTTTPFETEMTLRKKLPKKYWIHYNTILVAFGQHTCTPISPKCSQCPVHSYCMRVGVKKHT
jgi:endonuclease III